MMSVFPVCGVHTCKPNVHGALCHASRTFASRHVPLIPRPGMPHPIAPAPAQHWLGGKTSLAVKKKGMAGVFVRLSADLISNRLPCQACQNLHGLTPP